MQVSDGCRAYLSHYGGGAKICLHHQVRRFGKSVVGEYQLDILFAYLVKNMGVVNAEHFIALIKRDDFDYNVWQREYFDKFAPGEFAEKASAYAKSHPYTGKERYYRRNTGVVEELLRKIFPLPKLIP